MTADRPVPPPADAAVSERPGGAAVGFQIRDVLLAMQRGELRPPPAALLLGLRIVAVDPGRAVFALPLAEAHMNYAGTVNGGVIATLLDFAICSALNDVPGSSAVATANLAVTYQTPVPLAAAEIRATAMIVHRTAKTATAQATVTDLDGALYATALATVVARPMPA